MSQNLNLSKLAYFILTAVVLSVLGVYLNSKFSADVPSEKQVQPEEPELSKPKVRVATRPEPSQPSEPITEAPAKPLSVIAGEDDALILEAKEVLQLAAGPERTAKWHSVHFLEVELDVEPRVKHDVVAFQYNQTLAMVQSAMVLLVEDDVLANLGTWDVLRKTWEDLGGTKAACMVAYKTRTRPNCICAGDIYTGYLPWRGSVPQAQPSKVNWVGGGYTLYDAEAVKMCLPVVPRHHPTWTKGWDVDLCEKLRAGKRELFVTESVVAEHLFQ